MTATELYDFVENDDEINGVGFADGCLLIGNSLNSMITSVHCDNLGELEWADLRSVIVGAREPKALNHMSRVVGYYSMTSNWSKSKIGELRDRQKGEYGIGGSSKPSDKEGSELALDGESACQ